MKMRDVLASPGAVHSVPVERLGRHDSLGVLLQEAQLIDLRMDALTRRAGLIFDLRVALEIRDANTGVLVVDDVERLSWAGEGPTEPLIAWSVDGAALERGLGSITISLGLWPAPGGELTIVGTSGVFVAGNVPHLADVPPDYTETDRPGLEGLIADWESEFTPFTASVLA